MPACGLPNQGEGVMRRQMSWHWRLLLICLFGHTSFVYSLYHIRSCCKSFEARRSKVCTRSTSANLPCTLADRQIPLLPRP
jgi:hypothetical protein